MVRAPITALIEYLLSGIVYKKMANKISLLISLVLFFLATYQFGESIVFYTGYDRLGLSIAYFATTLLPPLGIMIVEKIGGIKLGAKFFAVIGVMFSMSLLLFNSSLVISYTVKPFCIAINEYAPIMLVIWSKYYFLGLLVAMIGLAWILYKNSLTRFSKQVANYMLAGYLSFLPTSMIIVKLFPERKLSYASIMCALALIGAIFFTKAGLEKDDGQK